MAVFTLVWLLARVYHDVPVAVAGHAEAAVAVRARVRLLARVCTHVHLQVRVLLGGVSAHVAHVPLEEGGAGVRGAVVRARLHVVGQLDAAHFTISPGGESVVQYLGGRVGPPRLPRAPLAPRAPLRVAHLGLY